MHTVLGPLATSQDAPSHAFKILLFVSTAVNGPVNISNLLTPYALSRALGSSNELVLALNLRVIELLLLLILNYEIVSHYISDLLPA